MKQNLSKAHMIIGARHVFIYSFIFIFFTNIEQKYVKIIKILTIKKKYVPSPYAHAIYFQNAVDYKVLALAQAPAGNATLITDNYKYLNLLCDPDTTTQTEILSAAAIETK